MPAHAGAGPARIEHAAISEHHVAQCLIVHETFGGGRQMVEKVHAAVILQQIHGGLWNHVQGTMRAAGSDALAAAFALVWIDKDAEHAAGFATLHRDVMIFIGLREQLLKPIAQVFALALAHLPEQRRMVFRGGGHLPADHRWQFFIPPKQRA